MVYKQKDVLKSNAGQNIWKKQKNKKKIEYGQNSEGWQNSISSSPLDTGSKLNEHEMSKGILGVLQGSYVCSVYFLGLGGQ